MALLSAMMDEGRLIPHLNRAGACLAAITVARPLVGLATPISKGETLLHDRGLNDGATISCLKRDLGIAAVFALKKEYWSYRYKEARRRGKETGL